MKFNKQMWSYRNHNPEIIAFPALHHSLVLIKSMLQHKAQIPTNTFGSRAILSY